MSDFTGLLTQSFLDIHRYAIEELISSLALRCKLIYTGVKYDDCEHCDDDIVVGKKASFYPRFGGPHPINFHKCSVCGGTKKIEVENSEEISLSIIWDVKDFISRGNIKIPQGVVQSISKVDPTLPKIKKATEAIFDLDLEPYVRHRFVRDGEPEPAGLGEDRFITTLWRKI